jgi:hypothetical protein
VQTFDNFLRSVSSLFDFIVSRPFAERKTYSGARALDR